MKLSLHKSAVLQRFLDVPHSAPVRLFFGIIGAVATRIATGDSTLARGIFRRIARQNDFRLGVRLTSWYVCRRWPRLRLSKFQSLVFTHALDADELAALRRFLDGRASRDEYALWLCDCAAASASLALLQPQTSGRFAADVRAILATLDIPDTLPTPSHATQSVSFSTAGAEEAIRDFAAAFPIAVTPWFVVSGTFLGVVREGGILPHDHDVDLGITFGDVDLVAFRQTLLVDARFAVVAEETQTVVVLDGDGRRTTRSVPVMLKVAHRNRTSIDVFIHHRDGNMIWHGSALYRWDNVAFDLKPYPFCGTTVLGPAEADRYLTENYGNWRVPVKTFHFSVDTTNLRVVRNPLSVVIFLRRAVMSDAAGRAALLRLLAKDGYLQKAGTGDNQYQFDPTAFDRGQGDGVDWKMVELDGGAG